MWVYYKLSVGEKEYPVVPFQVDTASLNVALSRVEIKSSSSNLLTSVDLAEIEVYAHNSKPGGEQLSDNITESTSSPEQPLIVFAPKKSQPQFILSEGDLRNVAAMASAHAKKEGSIALSDAQTRNQNEVLKGLNLTIDGAIWNKKPNDLVDSILPFRWRRRNGKYVAEDIQENREAYMKHLQDQVQLPDGYSWYDAQPIRSLLDVEVEEEDGGFRKTLKGTTDAVIAKTHHVENDAVRNHVAAQLELKRPDDKGNHEPQVCLEHLAASILNPNVPVLTGLTDLNPRWTFYWLGPSDDDGSTGVAIKKLVLTGHPECAALAKYLLESFDEKADATNRRETLPETFLDRLSWTQVRIRHCCASAGDSGESRGQNERHKRDRSDSQNDSGNTSNEESQQKMPKSSGDALIESLQLLCPRDDIANELDLLDELDEDERIRTVREFLSNHVVPRIAGSGPRNVLTDNTDEREAPSFLSASNIRQHDRSTQAL